MGKKSFWTLATVLLAANIVAFSSPGAAETTALDVRECACIYGGGPGGPEGPGTAVCMEWISGLCQTVEDCDTCPAH